MTFKFFAHRLKRMLGRPPELLYAVTRHWLIVGLLTAAGAIVLWADRVSSPVIYEGRAQLLVSPNDLLMQRLAPESAGMGRSRDQFKRFMNAQASLLSSHSVLRKMFGKLEEDGVSLPSPKYEQESEAGVARYVSSAKRRLSEVLRFDAPDSELGAREVALDRATSGFRRRSRIEYDSAGNSINLFVYGVEHKRIESELLNWIGAFVQHASDVSQTSWKPFLESRSLHYGNAVDTAQTDVDAFRELNLDVSESALVFVEHQIAQLLAPSRAAIDPEVNQLNGEKLRLELELAAFEERGVPETSREYRTSQRLLTTIQERLAARGAGGTANGSEGQLEKKREAVTEQLMALLLRKAELKEQLESLSRLRAKLDRAEEQREKFAHLTQESLDILESNKVVVVQDSDPPTVSAAPYNFHPGRDVLRGAAGGFGLGVLLAFLLEILCAKVRFRHDITDDFGLKVVTVLPR